LPYRKGVVRGAAKNLGCFGIGVGREKRFYRLRLRSYSFWTQLVSVILIPALLVAVTPTEVEAGQCAPVFYYYHSDHLGSSNVLTDRNGDVVRHYENYAYGKERYNDQACSFEVSNKYTGQILDEETGLYYYNARYYDPEMGRFIQPDTLVPTAADPQGLNRYSYCHNNPLNATDPERAHGAGHNFDRVDSGGGGGGMGVGSAGAAAGIEIC
jgi:RHS repeat-associated protein